MGVPRRKQRVVISGVRTSRRGGAVLAVLAVVTAMCPAAGVGAAHARGAARNTPVTSARSSVAQDPVRGFVDAHSHIFANVAFGGHVVCGKPFDPDGIEQALSDCWDHYPRGIFAWFENFTRYGTPFGTHDPTGYPTFEDWPAYNSVTHQQAYYKWIKRAWRGGLRLLVDHLVANRQLCEIYPVRSRPCGEMAAIRRQARLAHELEAFIDERNGGPGKGWFRIVTSAEQARRVIRAGKLAVILGVETSEPFGCRVIRGEPQCTRQDIDRGLDALYEMGVRTMFICHKYNNALCGVRFDSGAAGVFVNAANYLATGRFWDARTCTGELTDNTVSPAGVLPPVVAGLVPPLPVYPPGPHCNPKGLTELGEYMVRGMIERGMLIEIDHMSVKAADEVLDILEEEGYPGVVSSHSWTDPDLFPRIYSLGGMVAQYGHTADVFVRQWRRYEDYRDAHGISGYGFGIDVNGLGGLPAPRSGNAGNPVTYPFTTITGVTMHRARTGQQVWDINTDGMAHYGLLPDWIEDIRQVGGDEVVADLAKGAAAYLRTLEAAEEYEPGG